MHLNVIKDMPLWGWLCCHEVLIIQNDAPKCRTCCCKSKVCRSTFISIVVALETKNSTSTYCQNWCRSIRGFHFSIYSVSIWKEVFMTKHNKSACKRVQGTLLKWVIFTFTSSHFLCKLRLKLIKSIQSLSDACSPQALWWLGSTMRAKQRAGSAAGVRATAGRQGRG
jgi:hypothetical protein